MFIYFVRFFFRGGNSLCVGKHFVQEQVRAGVGEKVYVQTDGNAAARRLQVQLLFNLKLELKIRIV